MENLNVLNQNIGELANTFTFTTGLNIGNLLVKVRGDNGRDMFKSSAVKITEKDVLDVDVALGANGDKYVIKVDGELYRISRADSMPGKIQDRPIELMRAVVAYSVARQLKLKKANYKKFDACDVITCFGLPILDYKEKENRLYIKKNFSGVYNIEYLGLKLKLILNKKNMKLVSEGYIYYQINYNKLKDIKRLYLVDIGSLTTDCVFLDEGTPTGPDSLGKIGMLKLIEMLRPYLPSDMPEQEIEEMIRLGEINFMNTIYFLEDYSSVLDVYAERLATALKKKYSDINIAQKIILFGGGSYVLKGRIEKHFDSRIDIEILDDAEYVNADAYYLYAQQ